MKKLILTCLAGFLILTLCACGETGKQPAPPGQSATPSPSPTEDAPRTHDPGQGDPGDTGDLEWWGTYKNEDTGFAISIGEYSGKDFWAEITLLRNGQIVLAGKAQISKEDIRLAVLGDVGFYLNEGETVLDLVGSEDSEWAHMRGQYRRVEP